MRFSRPPSLLAGFYACEDPRSGPLFEAGEQWAPGDFRITAHANEGWEIFFQTRGSSKWKVGRDLLSVPPGGYYLIAPGVRHSLSGFDRGEAHFFFAVFDPAALGHAGAARWPRPWSAGAGAQALETPMRGLMRELVLDDPAKKKGAALYLSALCLEIDRLLTLCPGIEPDLATHTSTLRARDLIHAAPEHAWTVDELARRCHLSAQHLTEVFRRDCGESPWQYVIGHRITLAAELLRTSNRPVTRIALDLGFSSSQHFANAFRRLRGRSPSEERRMAQARLHEGALLPARAPSAGAPQPVKT